MKVEYVSEKELSLLQVGAKEVLAEVDAFHHTPKDGKRFQLVTQFFQKIKSMTTAMQKYERHKKNFELEHKQLHSDEMELKTLVHDGNPEAYCRKGTRHPLASIGAMTLTYVSHDWLNCIQCRIKKSRNLRTGQDSQMLVCRSNYLFSLRHLCRLWGEIGKELEQILAENSLYHQRWKKLNPENFFCQTANLQHNRTNRDLLVDITANDIHMDKNQHLSMDTLLSTNKDVVKTTTLDLFTTDTRLKPQDKYRPNSLLLSTEDFSCSDPAYLTLQCRDYIRLLHVDGEEIGFGYVIKSQQAGRQKRGMFPLDVVVIVNAQKQQQQLSQVDALHVEPGAAAVEQQAEEAKETTTWIEVLGQCEEEDVQQGDNRKKWAEVVEHWDASSLAKKYDNVVEPIHPHMVPISSNKTAT